MKSWAASASVLALVLACGASCSSSDSTSNGAEAAGMAGTGAAAGLAGSTGESDEGGRGGSAGAGFIDCTQLSPEACGVTTGCVELTARLVSSPPSNEDEPVGCVRSRVCSELNITARDPQGREWAFPDTCIPAGWVGEGGAGNDQ